MATKASRKIRTTPEQRQIRERDRLAKLLLPASRNANGFTLVDVANHSEGDQRHAIRSGETRTLRRKSKIDMLVTARIIDQDEAKVCEWYQATHEMAFETIGITADYGRSGGGGDRVVCLLAKYRAQEQARADFAYAREGIDRVLLHLLDKVVIYNRPLGRLGLTFRLAVRKLRERVEHMLPAL